MAIWDLPEDIVVQILWRLNLLSIVRFRCVSKSCYSLVPDSVLIRKHLNFNCASKDKWYRNKSVIIQDMNKNKPPIKFISLDPLLCDGVKFVAQAFKLPKESGGFSVWGHCDGMLLLDCCGTILLWNPSLGEYKMLPEIVYHCGSQVLCARAFGYDVWSNDYKVVQANALGPNNAEVSILDLKSDSWRTLEVYMHHPPNSSSPAINLNGYLYWQGKSASSGDRIVCFDLAEERFLELPQPPFNEYKGPLGILGGYLCMPRAEASPKQGLEFWILLKGNRDTRSWIKLMTIWKNSPQTRLPKFPWTPLCLTPDYGVLAHSENLLFLYNPHYKIGRPVILPIQYGPLLIPTLYDETLFSPNGLKTILGN